MATPRQRTTMRDVAREAGVSLQTVSNVLNDRPGQAGDETRARVQSAVEKLNYHRNPMARGLRAATADAFGFLVLDEASQYLADPMTDMFLAGAGDVMRDAGKALVIASSKPDWPVERLVAPVSARRIDGAIVLLSGSAARRRHAMEDLAGRGRFVLMQEHQPVPKQLSVVRAHDRAAGVALCRHLIDTGHQRIAFLTARRRWSAIEERLRGYRDALKAAGLARVPELEVWEGGFAAEDARLAAMRLFQARPRPTAIMCGNDLLAIGVARAARDLRLDLPEDVAIAGFDDFDFARFVDPPLTSVAVPGYEMGRQAALLLLEPEDGPTRAIEFEAELRIRGSTGAPPGG